jgi:N-acetyl-1-D-myo-inositol-2-amino-2-deoxy-alpha-D-glucopyranoside deacetylase
VPDGNLGRARATELADAARILGIAEVLMRDYPDGSLRWARSPEFEDEIVSVVRRLRPDAVITFAEDGLYWHPDHMGIHERTVAAVQSLDAAAPPLYYVTLPPGLMRGVVEAAAAKGWNAERLTAWNIVPEIFGLATRPPSFVVDVRPWVPRKLAALRCHRTQMGQPSPFALLDEKDASHWLGTEQFRRASLDAPGEPLLERLAALPHVSRP